MGREVKVQVGSPFLAKGRLNRCRLINDPGMNHGHSAWFQNPRNLLEIVKRLIQVFQNIIQKNHLARLIREWDSLNGSRVNGQSLLTTGVNETLVQFGTHGIKSVRHGRRQAEPEPAANFEEPPTPFIEQSCNLVHPMGLLSGKFWLPAREGLSTPGHMIGDQIIEE